MNENLCIDLCSGLGNFSQAFKNAKWEVITVDINPNFGPTICADVTELSQAFNSWASVFRLTGRKRVVVLASPPCERFSVASHAWPRPGIQKGMEIVGACLEIISLVKPNQWLLENPMGRLRWFLGKPTMTLRLCDFGSNYRKLTDFWGNIPLPMVEGMRQHTAYVANQGKSANLLPRPTNNRALKARMPLGLSQAILEAVEPPP